ncbi:TadE/TadG family type IV pilus assembly protein [Burkholderia alba]|uniref:TadE/TadG family type IV pilus assembly protein n=1 Tax=Burkholderia alba TaxID=2683677 RepID=UPI002B060988|nr:TadE/TadG family type IV pilus assembly protein [Burkholderia alba]
MRPAARPHAMFRRQRGATAVEFAILFPLFFVIMYAIVTYGMIFATQQSLTLAATEGARAALDYQLASTPAAAYAARANQACVVAKGLTTWLPVTPSCATNASGSTPTACSYDASMYCVQVTVTYPYSSNPLVPSIPLFTGPLPSTLTSQATVQINPANIL